MAAIGNEKVHEVIRESEYGEEVAERRISLVDFFYRLNTLKNSGAKVIPNGPNGVIAFDEMGKMYEYFVK